MISSHILDELAKVADCFGIINEGTLLDEFSAEELHQRSGQYAVIRTGSNEAAVSALHAAGILQVESEPDGTLRVTGQLDRTPLMARAIVEAGISLEEIYLKNVSLEDYYLGMTGGEPRA